MTPKQKLKSIEKKMQRIKTQNPDFDFDKSVRFSSQIQKYASLSIERFILKFEIEHCEKCGKKL